MEWVLAQNEKALERLENVPEFEPIELNLKRDPIEIEGIGVGVIRNQKL